MSSYFLALLLIFGLGHPARDPVDPAKSVPLRSRIPCDGYGAPEEAVKTQVTFSPGGSAREFAVSRFQNEKCGIDVGIKCLHKEKAGWRDVWTAASAPPLSNSILPLSSCYAWGSRDPAQYVLSGWYQEGADPKSAWRQVIVKQTSAKPEVYEFTDSNGATARLEIKR
jgi:hypothetical protein